MKIKRIIVIFVLIAGVFAMFYLNNKIKTEISAKATEMAIKKAIDLGYDVDSLHIAKNDIFSDLLSVNFRKSKVDEIDVLQIYVYNKSLREISIVGMYANITPEKDSARIFADLKNTMNDTSGEKNIVLKNADDLKNIKTNEDKMFEIDAFTQLRTIANACERYSHQQYVQHDEFIYPPDLKTLVKMELISKELADDQRNGYNFVYSLTESGYKLIAIPIETDIPNLGRFYIDEKGAIRVTYDGSDPDANSKMYYTK